MTTLARKGRLVVAGARLFGDLTRHQETTHAFTLLPPRLRPDFLARFDEFASQELCGLKAQVFKQHRQQLKSSSFTAAPCPTTAAAICALSPRHSPSPESYHFHRQQSSTYCLCAYGPPCECRRSTTLLSLCAATATAASSTTTTARPWRACAWSAWWESVASPDPDWRSWLRSSAAYAHVQQSTTTSRSAELYSSASERVPRRRLW